MIYRIAFWIGPELADTDSACADLHTALHVAGQFIDGVHEPQPAVPRIARFVEEVLEEFPEDGLDPRSPWKYGDVSESALGTTFVPVLYGPLRPVIGWLARRAHEHGLRVFDLAAHRLLLPQDIIEENGSVLIGGPLGGNGGSPEGIGCQGPEIARERLGLPDPAVLDDELADLADPDARAS